MSHAFFRNQAAQPDPSATTLPLTRSDIIRSTLQLTDFSRIVGGTAYTPACKVVRGHRTLLHLMMRCKAWLLPVTLLQGILASDVDMDPLSNLRPDNITGLIYSLYRWTGSYAILLKPVDH